MRARDGFTLIEMLIVVVLLGVLVLIGFPRMSSALVQTDVRGARTTMINLVARARSVAVQSNRLAWIKFEGNKAYVLAKPRRTVGGSGDFDTVGTVVNLQDMYGVTVASDVTEIQFDPRGVGSGLGGAKVAITVSRGSHTSQFTVDGLGRVTK